VLKSQLPEVEADGLCFFTSKQFVNGKFDLVFLEELLEKWTVGFARENVLVSTSNYPEVRSWLWREGLG
jgi:hypothetical protein